jgi:proline iminopeptidase
VNEGIYNYMQGPSEFTITGTLKRYDATPFLKDVKVPVLFTVGEFDEADPPTVKRQAAMTPGAKVAVISGAAHIVQWDNPDETNRVVREFLKSVDSAKAKP